MPRAIPYPIRQDIIERHQTGQSLSSIAQELHLSYRTVRTFWQRYCSCADAGLLNHYSECGPSQRTFPSIVQEAASTLKREHPRWGAGLIQLQLRKQFGAQPLPAWRTLQRWWQQAGLQRARGRLPPARRSRGQVPHQVWELDAKERIHLQEGSWSCVLCAVDEASGALLDARPFPPALLDPGASEQRASLPAPAVCRVGLA